MFGFTDPGVDRLSKPELGGGALLDIGVYAVNIIMLAFGDRPVKSIHATGTLNEHGVDKEVSGMLTFDSEDGEQDAHGQFFITFQADPPSEALIVGRDGWVKLHEPFWCATTMTIKMKGEPKEKEICFALPASYDEKRYNFTNSVLLQYEARHACEMLNKGAKESEVFGLDKSLQIIKLLDNIRSQVGTSYPADSQ